ncbi:unnamed protein product, partial [marine sediment metagenome]
EDVIEIFGAKIEKKILYSVMAPILGLIMGYLFLQRKRMRLHSFQKEIRKINDIRELDSYYYLKIRKAIEKEKLSPQQVNILNEDLNRRRGELGSKIQPQTFMQPQYSSQH